MIKSPNITVIHDSLHMNLLRRPLLIAPAHNIRKLHTMRLRGVLYLGDASDGVDQEDGFVVVHARQGVRALHVPINIVDYIGIECAGVATDEGVEEVGDVAARGVSAVVVVVGNFWDGGGG